MNKKDLISPILFILGGFVTIISILPIISNYFPIYSIKVHSYTGYGTFWGTLQVTSYNTNFVPVRPVNWTPLMISPSILVFTFSLLSIIVVILAFDSFRQFVHFERIKKIPVKGIIALLVGFLECILLELIYLGDSNNPFHIGLSLARPNFSIGLGYYLLVLSAILIILGSIIEMIGFYLNSKQISLE